MLKDQQVFAGSLTYQPGYLKRKKDNLDSVISYYQADTSSFRNNSISGISIIAERQGAKLSEVPIADPSFVTEKFIIQKMTFEGNFFSLTKTINELQTSKDVGVVRSFSYSLKRSADAKLYATIYLEILR